MRELIVFGGHVTGINCINYLTSNLDRILVASVWGAGPVGLYSRAYGLLLLPLQQVNAPIAAVAIPALSRLQDDPDRFRRFYCGIIGLIAYATMPVVVVLAVLSNEVVLIILGPQWGEAAVIFQIFSLFGLFYPVFATIGWVLLALGKTRRTLKMCGAVSVCTIAAFVAGLPWGPAGVALGATLCLGTSIIPSMAYAFRGTPISLADVRRATERPVIVSLLLALAAGGTYYLTAAAPMTARVIAVLLAALTVAGGVMAIWRPVREDVRAMVALRKR